MKKFITVFLLLILTVFCFSEEFKLSIFHTSDLHGNVFPIDYASNMPSNVGLAKLSTLLKNAEEENYYTVAIDTGDMIQGTPLEYYHAKIDNEPTDPMVKVMNYMGYLSTTVGNHEFNYGMPVLKKAMSEADFPFLSANIVKRFTDIPYFEPYIIVEVDENGITFAVLGLTTDFIPNWEDLYNIAEVDFLDPVETAKKYVPLLQEMADVVIVAYHGGFERDLITGDPIEELSGENIGYRLLKEVPGIDVLLTGHQHRLISEIVDGVVISQPSNWGKNAGLITLIFDDESGEWKLKDKNIEMLSTAGVDADPEVLAMAGEYEDKVQKWLDIPVGTAIGDFYVFDPLETRMGDSPLIEFVNKVQQHYSGVKISSTALFSNDIKGWKSGPITLRDINGVYIYANTLKVIEVTGQDIKDALEVSADYFDVKDGEVVVNDSWVNPKPRHYNYDMWEGIEYVIDPGMPVGERITELNYNGMPIDLNDTYEIVLNNYRAGGGGGYNMFKGKKVTRDIMVEVSELMADYILENSTIEATVDNNWHVKK